MLLVRLLIVPVIRPEKSEVNRLYGSNKLLKSLTNWEPKYSGVGGFERGLKETVDWFSQSKNLSYYKPENYAI